jgi:prepilin-type N-terminal cleavage/methylation domain-containing protein
MPSWRMETGWTLIELVVVILILGILATVTMVQISSLGRDAKDATLRGLAGAYGGQLVVAVNNIKGLPTGGGSLGVCRPTGISNRFRDCVYSMVPNPAPRGFTRSAYNNGNNRFIICSDTNTTACTVGGPVGAPTANGCGSTSERFVQVRYIPATGALTITGPFNCAS